MSKTALKVVPLSKSKPSGLPLHLEEEVRRKSPLPRSMLWVLFHVYGAPGIGSKELAEYTSLNYHSVNAYVWHLRQKGLLLSTSVIDKDTRYRSNEHECTKKGETLVEAWVQFLKRCGPQLCRELHFNLSDWT